ncbi:MAG: hypothetical protein QXM38_04030, partial [Candidatus Aenigmatarchaeota archaeon]
MNKTDVEHLRELSELLRSLGIERNNPIRRRKRNIIVDRIYGGMGLCSIIVALLLCCLFIPYRALNRNKAYVLNNPPPTATATYSVLPTTDSSEFSLSNPYKPYQPTSTPTPQPTLPQPTPIGIETESLEERIINCYRQAGNNNICEIDLTPNDFEILTREGANIVVPPKNLYIVTNVRRPGIAIWSQVSVRPYGECTPIGTQKLLLFLNPDSLKPGDIIFCTTSPCDLRQYRVARVRFPNLPSGWYIVGQTYNFGASLGNGCFDREGNF